jgi:hypothetical protein
VQGRRENASRCTTASAASPVGAAISSPEIEEPEAARTQPTQLALGLGASPLASRPAVCGIRRRVTLGDEDGLKKLATELSLNNGALQDAGISSWWAAVQMDWTRCPLASCSFPLAARAPAVAGLISIGAPSQATNGK